MCYMSMVELTTLSIITIEVPHSTGFTLQLLLGFQRCVWCNYVAIWAYANNNERNLELNTIYMFQSQPIVLRL